MTHRKSGFLAPFVLLAVVTACNQAPDAIGSASELRGRTSEGTVTTTSETRQVGTVPTARSENGPDTTAGAVAPKAETIVGTVTVFAAGKRIEVTTGDRKRHGFALDDKGVAYWIDGVVAVGKRVAVTDETGADLVRHITVKLSA